MENEIGIEKLQNWLDVLEENNLEKTLALYADNAILLGTLAPYPLVGKEAIASYFRDVFLPKHPVGDIMWNYGQKLSSSTIIVDGNYEFEVDEEGERVTVPARYTFVFRLKLKSKFWQANWEIISHHSSVQPISNAITDL